MLVKAVKRCDAPGRSFGKGTIINLTGADELKLARRWIAEGAAVKVRGKRMQRRALEFQERIPKAELDG